MAYREIMAVHDLRAGILRMIFAILPLLKKSITNDILQPAWPILSEPLRRAPRDPLNAVYY
jgi:hypothetical protein